ncbi:putative ribonuclease H-like domain-containing protein [Tanacetum coccineum]
MTLIEAARTMLAYPRLPTTFRAEAVNTACYVQNRVLVVEPHNKTPYEPFHGRTPTLSFMKPFGCPVTILNTKDHLGKFDGKADEGFFVGYSLNSKALRVFNSRTRIVEENLHIRFSENTPNVVGSGPDWLFDIDALTRTMNYEPIITGTQSNGFAVIGNNTNNVNAVGKVNTVSSSVNVVSTNDVNVVGRNISIEYPDDPNMPPLEDYSIFDNFNDDGAEADMTNLDTTIQVSPTPTTRIHKDHPINQVIGDLHSATQTRKMSKNLEEQGWIEAMQEELLQFKLQEVWTLVELPNGKRAVGTKCVFRNKRDKRGIVVRNKARLVAQGLCGVSMDVKSAFLYGKIEEEVYVYQPPGFEDPYFPDIVYKVENALYGLHQAPRAWKELCIAFEKLMHEKFQMSSMGELTFFLGLQVKQIKNGIFISQDKYVAEILKKFRFTDVKHASTPMETHKPLLKDEDSEEVDVHMYRSMIGSLMYLTFSRPDIMFVVCYPKDSPFDLVAYTDSDCAGASLDRKSTTGGCQFLGCRLISWQCKKQTMVANSTTEAEYVDASSCCGQVLWIQNQLLDYGKIKETCGIDDGCVNAGNSELVLLGIFYCC